MSIIQVERVHIFLYVVMKETGTRRTGTSILECGSAHVIRAPILLLADNFKAIYLIYAHQPLTKLRNIFLDESRSSLVHYTFVVGSGKRREVGACKAYR
jgi:hypothetical protein